MRHHNHHTRPSLFVRAVQRVSVPRFVAVHTTYSLRSSCEKTPGPMYLHTLMPGGTASTLAASHTHAGYQPQSCPFGVVAGAIQQQQQQQQHVVFSSGSSACEATVRTCATLSASTSPCSAIGTSSRAMRHESRNGSKTCLYATDNKARSPSGQHNSRSVKVLDLSNGGLRAGFGAHAHP